MPGEPAMGACPECGAANLLTATSCWMCGRRELVVSLDEAAPRNLRRPPSPVTSASAAIGNSVDDSLSRARPPAERSNRWFILGTTALVIVGVGFESTGLATLLTFVVGFPLIITLGTAASREARFRREIAARRALPDATGVGAAATKNRPMTNGEQVGLFLKWMAVAAGSVLVTAALLVVLLAVMIISVVTAFLEACGVLFHTAQGG